MSLLFNTLPRFDHTFPAKEQVFCFVLFNFMATITVHSDFGAQENKIHHCFHFFPFYLPLSDGTRCQDLSFFSVEFQVGFFTLLFHTYQEPLQEKEMATYSSILAWKSPWTEEPGGLESMGLHD